MTTDLITTFTPKDKEGDTDFRYESDLQNIFDTMRPEVLIGLQEFKHKTTQLEIKYGSLALEFALNWIKYTDQLYADDTFNKYNFKAKSLNKYLGEGLKVIGFKPKNIYKLIAAARFHKRLQEDITKDYGFGLNEHAKEVYEFVLTLPISSQYLLGGMTDEGITKAMEYEDITVREIEKLKQKYPINTEERRGRRKNPLTQLERVSDNQEAITIESTEVKEVTQESIARDIVSLAKQINREVWKDQEIISILKEAQSELWNIAHIAAQPTKELTTN
jgi:hypothetical protein|tara:strand:+ start:211 stop:1038 length:828 start_codon:yes stop_codon:yes gene_type:complete